MNKSPPQRENELFTNQIIDLSVVADRTRPHIMRRMMPYLFLLFMIAYLDRVNVGYLYREIRVYR